MGVGVSRRLRELTTLKLVALVIDPRATEGQDIAVVLGDERGAFHPCQARAYRARL